MTRILRGVVLCAGLAACATRAPRTAAEYEAQLGADTVTDVRTDRFELTSPYDADATAEFARVVGDELALVETLFGDPGGAPVRVHLVPLAAADADARDPFVCAMFPSRGGHAGATISSAASGAEFVWLYVTAPGAGPPAFVEAAMRHDTIRHELTHFIAKRQDLARTTWFDEGLAREVEAMPADDRRLREPSFAGAIVTARNTARLGTVAELLAWRSTDDLTPAASALRYDQAQALLRFLVARTPDGAWIDRVRRVRAFPDDAILAAEPDWLAWLASQDALAAIRDGLARPDSRARAAAMLPSLANVAPELRSRAADDLAIELLHDASTRESASTFLLCFRAKDVTADDLASLRASLDPSLVLVGEALLARRGEPFDARRAREIWDGLAATQRAECYTAAYVLGLMGEPLRPDR